MIETSEPQVSKTDPERILALTQKLNSVAGNKIGEITTINRAAKMLSMNAMVVAARAGEHGKGFAVVADEFKNLSTQIDTVAAALDQEVRGDLKELTLIGEAIIGHLRGQRLADLALNAIEIIDRNLYERTCDVRWWATDSAVVACLQTPSADASAYASSRLKVILDSYTVYLDLWICDRDGRVVATGRPARYPATRTLSVAHTSWFRQAMQLRSSDEFVAADVERNRALQDSPVATYAASIRAEGNATGPVLGVLGIHFDWDAQAKTVVDGVRLSDKERAHTRVMLLDKNFRVIAASDGQGVLTETFPIQVPADQPLGSYTANGATIAYARTPGYETYQGLGWYGCLVQTRDHKGPN